MNVYAKSRRRWGDNDFYFGPFTYAYTPKGGHRPIEVVLASGCDEYPGALFRVSAFGHTVIAPVPGRLLRPYREKVYPNWDAETVKRLGRNWYWQIDGRSFGFRLSEGHFSIFRGRTTMDSSTDRTWSCFLPWTEWRSVRHSFYGVNGEHFASLPDIGKPYGRDMKRFDREQAIRDSVPTVSFEFADFDGERITATTKIEECEWKLGTGWFKWLSVFRRPRIARSLDIQFSAETGPRKGSWKGGTVGHGIDMRDGELHEDAFRRYCAENNMTFVGAAK